MASARFEVQYYYFNPSNKGGKNSVSLSGEVKSQSETLVMQKLREKHKGMEIQLVKIKWK